MRCLATALFLLAPVAAEALTARAAIRRGPARPETPRAARSTGRPAGARRAYDDTRALAPER